MKRLIVVLDGAMDSFIDNKTPLINAKTPNLDALCCKGRAMRIKTVYDDQVIASDLANMNLMALDSKLHFPGRSAIELLGINVSLHSEDYTFRANLVSYQPHTTYIASTNAYSVTDEENKSLMADLAVIFKKHQFELFTAGKHMYLAKTAVDYAKPLSVLDMLGKDSHFHAVDAPKRLALINDVEKLLKGHTVNIKRAMKKQPTIDGIWLWAKGSGKLIGEVKRDKAWAVITATPVIKGLARLVGDYLIESEQFTGDEMSNFTLKAKKVIESLRQHDTVYCHIDALDEISHAKKRILKTQTIEKIDSAFFSVIKDDLAHYDTPVELYVMADHGTCSQTGEHFGEIVPCLYALAPWKNTGNIERFNENMGLKKPILDPKQWKKRISNTRYNKHYVLTV